MFDQLDHPFYIIFLTNLDFDIKRFGVGGAFGVVCGRKMVLIKQ